MVRLQWCLRMTQSSQRSTYFPQPWVLVSNRGCFSKSSFPSQHSFHVHSQQGSAPPVPSAEEVTEPKLLPATATGPALGWTRGQKRQGAEKTSLKKVKVCEKAELKYLAEGA